MYYQTHARLAEVLYPLLQDSWGVELSRKKLVELANADDTPMVVALIARGMAGAKGHEFLVRDLWDRQHGRPKQEVKVEEAGEVRHVITFRRGDKASSNPGEV